MRSVVMSACFAVLAAACGSVATPTATPSAPPTATPSASPSVRSWSIYRSEIKTFSLQVPSDWEIRPGIDAEGVLLQINAGEDGRVLMLEEEVAQTESFESLAKRYFDAILEDNPDAIEFVSFESGRAARVDIPGQGATSVLYLYPPDGGASQVLSFTWDHPTPNPVWQMVAERFNPSSTEPIIPFGSPSPS